MTQRKPQSRRWLAVSAAAGVLLAGGGIATAAAMVATSTSLTTGDQVVGVPKVAPSLSASPAPASAVAGSAVSDVAHLSGATTTARGTMNYALYGPGDPTCTGAPIAQRSTAVSGDGDYAPSPAPTATAIGTYNWVVFYSGDDRNEAVPSSPSCGNGGQVSISASTSAMGLIWTSVTVNDQAQIPTCTGSIGSSTYQCTVTGGNNAVLKAKVAFSTSSGSPTVFSTANDSSVSMTYVGKMTPAPGPTALTIPANSSTSTGVATTTRNGSNVAKMTASFNGWTAELSVVTPSN